MEAAEKLAIAQRVQQSRVAGDDNREDYLVHLEGLSDKALDAEMRDLSREVERIEKQRAEEIAAAEEEGERQRQKARERIEAQRRDEIARAAEAAVAKSKPKKGAGS